MYEVPNVVCFYLHYYSTVWRRVIWKRTANCEQSAASIKRQSGSVGIHLTNGVLLWSRSKPRPGLRVQHWFHARVSLQKRLEMTLRCQSDCCLSSPGLQGEACQMKNGFIYTTSHLRNLLTQARRGLTPGFLCLWSGHLFAVFFAEYSVTTECSVI